MKVAAITKFKHGALFELLQELGWTQKEFSVRSKIPYTSMNKILAMTMRPSEQQIAAMENAFGNAGRFVDVASFFPDSYIGFKRALSIVQVEDVEPAQLEYYRQYQTRMLEDAQPPVPSDLIDSADKLQQIEEFLAGTKGDLTERERDVIRSHTAGQTFEEMAQRYGLSRQSMVNSFYDGLRKIRNYFELTPIPQVAAEEIAAHSRNLTKDELDERARIANEFDLQEWRRRNGFSYTDW